MSAEVRVYCRRCSRTPQLRHHTDINSWFSIYLHLRVEFFAGILEKQRYNRTGRAEKKEVGEGAEIDMEGGMSCAYDDSDVVPVVER